ncbi:M15 family metallopeptidase [Seonamhaeicola sp.]|uniref:M15 family metallopeptidase n=1 Tax=Seonamhaeicola sp. TaxID=1912245 RepID=UPI002620B6E4|nr:M15 family metallopeptidase [Seonamhaeicola sp.]
MIKVIIRLCLFLFCVSSFGQLPEGFVYVNEIIPDLEIELRYYTENNFVGKRIDGYNVNKLILTGPTAKALKLVQEDLQSKNLCLKVFDGYRPQTAVNHFMRWAKNLNDTINKSTFYPDVKKEDLFKEEYIAARSGHSRGSTVDLTIIDANSGQPIDMGSVYDFFGMQSWVNYNGITDEQKANRQLLQDIMAKYGFNNYPKEWWHFTLKEEPFPETYFDFPIK